MTVLSWVMTGCSILGTIANSFQKFIGFIFWIIANIFWVIFNIINGIYAQAVIYAFNTIMCIIGLIAWGKKEVTKEESKEESKGDK